MSRFTIDEFVQHSSQQDRGQGVFELESEYMLEVNLAGEVRTKLGSMVAYIGDVKFTREGIRQEGIGNFLKRQFTGEGAKLTTASGTGKVYLADDGKRITVLEMNNDVIVVNGEDLLAMTTGLQHKTTMMKKVAAIASGGLFNVRVEGTGMIAITTHHNPLTLRVTPGVPVFTDPNATVAWSGTLEPQFKTDVSLKTFIGRGSGESFQMMFEGDGWVVVQPYEETPLQASS